MVGLVNRAIQLGRQGDGVKQVAEGNEKREQYGYWEARLKDGFHFEPVRKSPASGSRTRGGRETAGR